MIFVVYTGSHALEDQNNGTSIFFKKKIKVIFAHAWVSYRHTHNPYMRPWKPRANSLQQVYFLPFNFIRYSSQLLNEIYLLSWLNVLRTCWGWVICLGKWAEVYIYQLSWPKHSNHLRRVWYLFSKTIFKIWCFIK